MTRTIAIIYDKKLKPETEVPAQSAIKYLKERECTVKVNPKMFNIGIDAAIVYGGDGLLLHIANQVANCNIPIIGVNYGRVGFLCKADKNQNYGLWDKIVRVDYLTERRTRIMAEITYDFALNTEGVTEIIDALNEIAIGGIDKTVYLNLYINPRRGHISKSNPIKAIGDGIIFATETGSTAYNVNAGGSVLLTDVFSVVSNNCLFQSNMLPINTKALVTYNENHFEVDIANKNKENLPYLVAYGQRRVKLSGNEKIIIKKSTYDTIFITI